MRREPHRAQDLLKGDARQTPAPCLLVALAQLSGTFEELKAASRHPSVFTKTQDLLGKRIGRDCSHRPRLVKVPCVEADGMLPPVTELEVVAQSQKGPAT